VTPFNGTGKLRALRAQVETQGWVWERPKTDLGRTYWILYRPESPPIGEHHRHFIRGPGLASLRDNPAAIEAATDYAASTGVNPLSNNELRDTYEQHRALMRRFRIWGNVAALMFAIPLLVTFLLTARTSSRVRTPRFSPLCTAVYSSGSSSPATGRAERSSHIAEVSRPTSAATNWPFAQRCPRIGRPLRTGGWLRRYDLGGGRRRCGVAPMPLTLGSA
jgi:hypothetical protein